jgi:hypothetical protein
VDLGHHSLFRRGDENRNLLLETGTAVREQRTQTTGVVRDAWAE